MAKYGGELDRGLLQSLVDELAQLVSDADLLMAAQALSTCTTLLLQQPSCAEVVSKAVLPPALRLVQSQLLQVGSSLPAGMPDPASLEEVSDPRSATHHPYVITGPMREQPAASHPHCQLHRPLLGVEHRCSCWYWWLQQLWLHVSLHMAPSPAVEDACCHYHSDLLHAGGLRCSHRACACRALPWGPCRLSWSHCSDLAIVQPLSRCRPSLCSVVCRCIRKAMHNATPSCASSPASKHSAPRSMHTATRSQQPISLAHLARLSPQQHLNITCHPHADSLGPPVSPAGSCLCFSAS